MLTLCLVLFVSSAYAGSCPMLAENIDDKIKKAQELKDQGMDEITFITNPEGILYPE